MLIPTNNISNLCGRWSKPFRRTPSNTIEASVSVYGGTHIFAVGVFYSLLGVGGFFTPIEVSIGLFFGARTAIANRRVRYWPVGVNKTTDRSPPTEEQPYSLFAIGYRGEQNHSLNTIIRKAYAFQSAGRGKVSHWGG